MKLLLVALLSLGVKLPTPEQLVSVVRGGDEVEIERVAHRLGASRLLKAARTGPHDVRLAALRALPLAEDAWGELVGVAALIGDPDPEIAQAAGRAARRIAEDLTPEVMFEGEVPQDVPRSALAALFGIGARKELPSEARVQAIAAAGPLEKVVRPAALDVKPIATLLADPDAGVRRAAAEDLPRSPQARPLVEKALADPDPGVAATAAATLCADVPPLPSKAVAEQAARALSPAAKARVRALLDDEQVSLVDRLDLVPCLRAFAGPDDKKLLDRLARSPDDHIKRRARSFGGR